jgi:hypothetical protein
MCVCSFLKAVHLEVVSDLTTEAFLAAFHRFVSRRGKPSLVWSDNGTNFVRAARELKSLFDLLKNPKNQEVISSFCSSQGICWKFIPERARGLWEAAVKSTKLHLKKIVGEVKLTFEEMSTMLEACLNSRPLTILPDSTDGLDVLTPGHFIIGRPIEALPDSVDHYQPQSLLRRWQLCQSVTRQFWRRWSAEYLTQLQKFTKWKRPTRNLQVGDLVCLHDDGFALTVWPMGRIVKTYKGVDGIVRVVTVRTCKGEYKRPVHKLALILPVDE